MPRVAESSVRLRGLWADSEAEHLANVEVRGLDGATVALTPGKWGWSVSDRSGEWELLVLTTSRQDGQTAWGVAYVTIDGEVEYVPGFSPTDEANRAISRLAGGSTSEECMRECQACGEPIPAARLAAVPDTSWCVRCAETRVERVGGNMVWEHKTAPTIEVKSMAAARRFARATRRRTFNAQLGVESYAGAQDARAGVRPFERE